MRGTTVMSQTVFWTNAEYPRWVSPDPGLAFLFDDRNKAEETARLANVLTPQHGVWFVVESAVLQ
jgi:hypothetical protein